MIRCLSIIDIVSYLTCQERSIDHTEWFCDCANFGYHEGVPLKLQCAINAYVKADPGDSAAYWYNEASKIIGLESNEE